MANKKLFIGLLVAVLFITFQSSESLGGTSSWGIKYTRVDYTVKEMPLEFRSVPIHNEDGYASQNNWGAIADTSYNRKHIVSLDYAYLWDLNERFSLGLGIVWIPDFWDNLGEERRRNYTNHPGTETRGYGAALTFVGTGIRGLVEIGSGESYGSFWNFTPEIMMSYYFSNEKESGIKLVGSYHRFVALNGWDRYDEFEIKDNETLAHIFPVTLELYYKFFSIGVSYNISELTNFGKMAETEIGKVSFSFKFGKDF